MSVHISSIVWKSKLQNAGLKMVLLALADIANHEGECWPSVGTLGEMTCLGQTAVKGHIQALKESGIITIEPRHTGTGRQTSNFFRIHTDALLSWGEGSESDASQKATGEGSKSDGGRGSKSDPPRGQNPAPLIPSKEPPPEPPKEPTPKPQAPEPQPPASLGEPVIPLEFAAIVTGLAPPNDETNMPEPPEFIAQKLTDGHVRLAEWFNRRPSTKWSDKELRAFKNAKPTEEDLNTLEPYYTAPKEAFPTGRDYRRRDILTLLNNWPGEVDRARAYTLTLTRTNGPSRFSSTIGK